MLVKSDYVPKLAHYTGAFKDPVCFHIYEIIRTLYREDEEIDARRIFDSLDEMRSARSRTSLKMCSWQTRTAVYSKTASAVSGNGSK